MRQEQWTQAAAMLERAFNRDPSRANAAVALPAIEQITRHDPSEADCWPESWVIDPAAAKPRCAPHLDAAVAGGDFTRPRLAPGG